MDRDRYRYIYRLDRNRYLSILASTKGLARVSVQLAVRALSGQGRESIVPGLLFRLF